jgi:hypothetical protein
LPFHVGRSLRIIVERDVNASHGIGIPLDDDAGVIRADVAALSPNREVSKNSGHVPAHESMIFSRRRHFDYLASFEFEAPLLILRLVDPAEELASGHRLCRDCGHFPFLSPDCCSALEESNERRSELA